MTYRGAGFAAAVALGAALVAAPDAAAQEESPAVGVVVQHDDGSVETSVRLADLYPTATRQVVFFLAGEDPGAVRRMRLGVQNLEDVDNACVRPETNAGDTTCGDDPGAGELSQFLSVTLTAGQETKPRSCTPVPGTRTTATLAALAVEPATVGLPGGDGLLCVIATVTHDEVDGDNVTQTDITRFDLLMELDSLPVVLSGTATDGDEVGSSGGGATTSGGGTPGARGTDDAAVSPSTFEDDNEIDLGLARTGVELSTLLGFGAVTLGLGALLVLAPRRRARLRRPRRVLS